MIKHIHAVSLRGVIASLWNHSHLCASLKHLMACRSTRLGSGQEGEWSCYAASQHGKKTDMNQNWEEVRGARRSHGLCFHQNMRIRKWVAITFSLTCQWLIKDVSEVVTGWKEEASLCNPWENEDYNDRLSSEMTEVAPVLLSGDTEAKF